MLAIFANGAIFLSKSTEIKPMPTRNISLTTEQDAFIEEMLKAGEYGNASEAMRDAIRALQQRRTEESLKLERLRLSIKQGVAALDRGDYSNVADEELDAYLDDLAVSARR
jgi:antitoxin ParD1/3/4